MSDHRYHEELKRNHMLERIASLEAKLEEQERWMGLLLKRTGRQSDRIIALEVRVATLNSWVQRIPDTLNTQ